MRIISRIAIIVMAITLSNAIAAQEKSLSQQVAETVLKIWPDSIPVGSQTKWSYDMGVVLKGFEGIWMNTGDVSYFNSIQKKINFFMPEASFICTWMRFQLAAQKGSSFFIFFFS